MFFKIIIVFTSGIRFVADHHAGPLAVAHRAGAAVGQEVDINIVAGQQEDVVAGIDQGLAAVFEGGRADRLDHFDAEGFGKSFHGFPRGPGCCGAKPRQDRMGGSDTSSAPRWQCSRQAVDQAWGKS